MIITMTAIMMTMIHGQIRVTIMTMMTGIITTTMMIMPMTMKDGAIILTETGRDVSRVSCLWYVMTENNDRADFRKRKSREEKTDVRKRHIRFLFGLVHELQIAWMTASWYDNHIE